MKRWIVMFALEASMSVDVEADTQEEAEKKAWKKAEFPTLCHQCSDQFDLGDPIAITETMEIEVKPCPHST
jgi:hypothetical protein